ncbi:S8 family serine peptidase [Micromonosporaceae bacterium Da 78-11]
MRARVRELLVGLVAGTLTLGATPAVAATEPEHTAYADAITPDDPAYRTQWGLTRSRVDQAWSSVRGSARVTVAVVDSGVSKLPDLAGRVLPGHDFVNDDDDATDDNGHGTMAAGVIAATGDNRTGIAGICWGCRILPVKVLDAKGSGSYTDIAEGIRYAADRDATIISLSLGGSDDSQLLRDAVTYAVGKGSLVIAAAGNAGTSARHYPAAFPEVLAVGGVTATDTRYSWSNYGSDWVDLTAPGCNPAQGRDGVLGQYCGTSSATPFVAGVAALLAATDPAPSAAVIRTALTSSSVRPSGRVDAMAALGALPYGGDTTAPAVLFGSAPVLARGRVTVTAVAADQHGVGKVQLYAGGRLVATDTAAPYLLSWNSAPLSATVPLELRAYDRAGNVAVARRAVRVDNTPPAVRVAGNRRYAATVRLTARATDASGISRLDLLVNGKVVARHAGYLRQFTIRTARYGRTVTAQVRAYDRAGNVRVAPALSWRR